MAQRLARVLSRLKFETLRKNARAVARESGKSVPGQIAEIVALRFGVGKLLPHEYYQYQLYDDRRYSWQDKKRFLGSPLENKLIPFLREDPWLGLANDKLASYAFFNGMGFPIPETYAVYHAYREFGSVRSLKTREQAAAYLRSGEWKPFVCKPIYGMWGRDVWSVAAYDASSDSLRLGSGDAIPVDTFLDRLAPRLRTGYVLQELLLPHPDIAKLCGERLCSVRMVSIIDHEGPRLISTLWKIATGRNMADNYWGAGNMVVAIDKTTGTLGRPFTGLGRELRYVDRHPDTGELLTGQKLPDWEEAVNLCLHVTSTLPGIPMQAWDIALTSRGPVLLEVNINGGMRLPQLTRQGGLYDDELKRFLANFGFPKKTMIGRLLERKRNRQ